MGFKRRCRPVLIGLLAAALTALLAGCSTPPDDGGSARSAARTRAATYTGGEVCAGCHREQAELWRGSYHDLAMQPAGATTVLGNFDGVAFTYAGVTTTFSRRDGRYLVRTDGPDGELREYEIAYTFGVEPLQQYLVELPDGRYQALSICWDTRPAEEGGQRWFHLYPDDEVTSGDPLHWTGALQNWNYMCAECHSTGLVRNYRPREDRYETAYAEVDVACEACHGPGSRHVAWARAAAEGEAAQGLAVALGDGGVWTFDEGGTARRHPARTSHAEIETCGRCHARRAPIADYRHGRPLADSHRLALLDELLYHADGQIRDEVYVYGSFLQSKMYREGVTCSDCHDPHSARLLAAGNAVCARCHSPAQFDTPAHHFHPPDSAGARCAECHMPARTYMVVDPRRDHSFRLPRPDLSMKIGVPNACTGCHADRAAAWAAARVGEWYGPQRAAVFHFGEAIHAGRTWQPEARDLLLRMTEDPESPGIARATALTLLPRFSGPGVPAAVEAALGDGDPLLRRAALTALEAADPPIRLRLGYPLLADPIRTVRLEAARILAAVPAGAARPDQLAALKLGLDEYRAAQLFNAERAEAQLNLAWLELNSGEPAAAESAYRRALDVQPGFLPTYVNLADLYRQQGRDGEGEALLRRALEIFPEEGDLHHALGLNLVRQQRLGEALAAFARAVELTPDRPHYRYVYGVALHGAGEPERAFAVLESAHRRFPADRELLLALVSYHRDRGTTAAAIDYARRLVELVPDDPGARRLLEQLETER